LQAMPEARFYIAASGFKTVYYFFCNYSVS
jgi:hypothetical protein